MSLESGGRRPTSAGVANGARCFASDRCIWGTHETALSSKTAPGIGKFQNAQVGANIAPYIFLSGLRERLRAGRTGNVGCEDGREPPLHPLSGHINSPRSITP